ncbi:MAG: DUF4340 domain-containing protein [Clostridia bacterium]|nr:DUF4340 domain-containing protein [Clostridia bacterium]
MIKKQKILIIVLSVLFAALIVGYFAVIKPIVDREEPQETTAPVETEAAGEVVGFNDRILMFEHTEKKDIRSIEVHNNYGTYTFYRDADDNFQIKGFEGIVFDQELMSSLVVSAGYTLSMAKVDDPVSMEEYGLVKMTQEDGTVWEPAWYKLTTKTGIEHVVYIGYPLVTEGGYYAKYAGRSEVYVLNTDLAKTILAPIEDMVTPMAVWPMAMNNYFTVDNFVLMEGEEIRIAIGYNSEEQRVGEFSNQVYHMIEPEGYNVSSIGYDAVLQTLYSSTPLRCIKLGITDEALTKYGLDNPAYSLYFEFPDPELGQVIENLVLISARNASGNYYIASGLFNQIIEVAGIDWDFLTWDFIDWVDAPIFQRNIDYVREIRVESPNFSETYLLEGKGQALVVTQKSNGRKPDVPNFRQFYKTLLTASIEGNMPAEMTEADLTALATPANCQLTLTIITDSTTLEYKLYPYTERRSYLTINGDGRFYMLRSMADKIIADADRVTRDEPINSEGKY